MKVKSHFTVSYNTQHACKVKVGLWKKIAKSDIAMQQRGDI